MAPSTYSRLTGFVVLIVILIAAADAAYSVFRIITTSAPDFFYYYEAAGEFLQRVDHPMHMLPPASFLLFAPLRLLPYGLAQTMWIITSFFCLIGIVWKMSVTLGIRNTGQRVLIAALFSLSFPAQFTIGMGQVNLIVLWLLLVAVEYERHTQSFSAAGVLTACFLLKPELIFLGVSGIIGRKWKLLGLVAVVMALSVFVSLALFGWEAYARYVVRLLPLVSGWEDAGIYYNQSLSGMLVRAGIAAPWWYLAAASVMIGASVYMLWRKGVTFPESLWRLLPVLVLTEPIAWQHHFVFLFPLYLLLWVRLPFFRPRFLLAISMLLVSGNFVSPGFLDTMPLGWLVSSHATVGALMLWGMAYWKI